MSPIVSLHDTHNRGNHMHIHKYTCMYHGNLPISSTITVVVTMQYYHQYARPVQSLRQRQCIGAQVTCPKQCHYYVRSIQFLRSYISVNACHYYVRSRRYTCTVGTTFTVSPRQFVRVYEHRRLSRALNNAITVRTISTILTLLPQYQRMSIMTH